MSNKHADKPTENKIQHINQAELAKCLSRYWRNVCKALLKQRTGMRGILLMSGVNFGIYPWQPETRHQRLKIICILQYS
jgi:hypothetical protein